MESLHGGSQHRKAGAAVRAALAAAALALTSSCAKSAAPADGTPAPGAKAVVGFYSSEQAARGQAVFRSACGGCHKTSEFRGRDFEWRWRRQTVWNLYTRMTATMPETAPGTLPSRTYADVIAYLLELNNYRSGAIELVPTAESMESIPLGPGASRAESGGGGR